MTLETRSCRIDEATMRQRNLAAGLSLGVSAVAVLLALDSHPFERQPAFPLNPDQTKELYDLDARVPEAVRENKLEGLADERNHFFQTVGSVTNICGNDGLQSISSWEMDVRATGNEGRPYRTVVTSWRTGFTCGDHTWLLVDREGEPHFEAQRGATPLFHWEVPVSVSGTLTDGASGGVSSSNVASAQ